MGQWDTVLKGRVKLATHQQKRTQSIVGLWDTVLKEILLYRADPIRFVGQWDTGFKGRIKRTQGVVRHTFETVLSQFNFFV